MKIRTGMQALVCSELLFFEGHICFATHGSLIFLPPLKSNPSNEHIHLQLYSLLIIWSIQQRHSWSALLAIQLQDLNGGLFMNALLWGWLCVQTEEKAKQFQIIFPWWGSPGNKNKSGFYLHSFCFALWLGSRLPFRTSVPFRAGGQATISTQVQWQTLNWATGNVKVVWIDHLATRWICLKVS